MDNKLRESTGLTKLVDQGLEKFKLTTNTDKARIRAENLFSKTSSRSQQFTANFANASKLLMKKKSSIRVK